MRKEKGALASGGWGHKGGTNPSTSKDQTGPKREKQKNKREDERDGSPAVFRLRGKTWRGPNERDGDPTKEVNPLCLKKQKTMESDGWENSVLRKNGRQIRGQTTGGQERQRIHRGEGLGCKKHQKRKKKTTGGSPGYWVPAPS